MLTTDEWNIGGVLAKNAKVLEFVKNRIYPWVNSLQAAPALDLRFDLEDERRLEHIERSLNCSIHIYLSFTNGGIQKRPIYQTPYVGEGGDRERVIPLIWDRGSGRFGLVLNELRLLEIYICSLCQMSLTSASDLVRHEALCAATCPLDGNDGNASEENYRTSRERFNQVSSREPGSGAIRTYVFPTKPYRAKLSMESRLERVGISLDNGPTTLFYKYFVMFDCARAGGKTRH
jgi:hypothetical protein